MVRGCKTCLRVIKDPSEGLYITSVSSDSSEVSLEEKLRDCIPELILEDAQNVVLCHSCVGNLTSAYEFKQRCLEAQQKIYGFLQQVPSNNQIDVGKIAVYYQRMESIAKVAASARTDTSGKPQKMPYNCTQCQFACLDKCVLCYHEILHKSDAPPYKCNQCSFIFPTTTLLLDHLATHTNEQPYACNLCDFVTAVHTDLKEHGADHRKSFQCTICWKRFAGRKELDSHVEGHNNEEDMRLYQCGWCNFKCDSMSMLQNHRNDSHQHVSKCKVCKVPCRTKLGLMKHMKWTHSQHMEVVEKVDVYKTVNCINRADIASDTYKSNSTSCAINSNKGRSRTRRSKRSNRAGIAFDKSSNETHSSNLGEVRSINWQSEGSNRANIASDTYRSSSESHLSNSGEVRNINRQFEGFNETDTVSDACAVNSNKGRSRTRRSKRSNRAGIAFDKSGSETRSSNLGEVRSINWQSEGSNRGNIASDTYRSSSGSLLSNSGEVRNINGQFEGINETDTVSDACRSSIEPYTTDQNTSEVVNQPIYIQQMEKSTEKLFKCITCSYTAKSKKLLEYHKKIKHLLFRKCRDISETGNCSGNDVLLPNITENLNARIELSTGELENNLGSSQAACLNQNVSVPSNPELQMFHTTDSIAHMLNNPNVSETKQFSFLQKNLEENMNNVQTTSMDEHSIMVADGHQNVVQESNPTLTEPIENMDVDSHDKENIQIHATITGKGVGIKHDLNQMHEISNEDLETSARCNVHANNHASSAIELRDNDQVRKVPENVGVNIQTPNELKNIFLNQLDKLNIEGRVSGNNERQKLEGNGTTGVRAKSTSIKKIKAVRKVFKCALCTETRTRRSSLRKHIKKVHSKPPNLKLQVSHSSCNYVQQNTKNVDVAANDQPKKVIKCSVCSLVCENNKIKNRHWWLVHSTFARRNLKSSGMSSSANVDQTGLDPNNQPHANSLNTVSTVKVGTSKDGMIILEDTPESGTVQPTPTSSYMQLEMTQPSEIMNANDFGLIVDKNVELDNENGERSNSDAVQTTNADVNFQLNTISQHMGNKDVDVCHNVGSTEEKLDSIDADVNESQGTDKAHQNLDLTVLDRSVQTQNIDGAKKSGMWVCGWCSEELTSFLNLSCHLKTVHQKTVEVWNSLTRFKGCPSQYLPSNTYICKLCSFHTEKRMIMRNHLRAKHKISHYKQYNNEFETYTSDQNVQIADVPQHFSSLDSSARQMPNANLDEPLDQNVNDLNLDMHNPVDKACNVILPITLHKIIDTVQATELGACTSHPDVRIAEAVHNLDSSHTNIVQNDENPATTTMVVNEGNVNRARGVKRKQSDKAILAVKREKLDMQDDENLNIADVKEELDMTAIAIKREKLDMQDDENLNVADVKEERDMTAIAIKREKLDMQDDENLNVADVKEERDMTAIAIKREKLDMQDDENLNVADVKEERDMTAIAIKREKLDMQDDENLNIADVKEELDMTAIAIKQENLNIDDVNLTINKVEIKEELEDVTCHDEYVNYTAWAVKKELLETTETDDKERVSENTSLNIEQENLEANSNINDNENGVNDYITID